MNPINQVALFQNIKNHSAELFDACKTGDYLIFKNLIESSPYLKNSRLEGLSLIQYAAAGGHTRIVFLLLEMEADYKKKDGAGYDALALACMGGHIDVVEILVACDISLLNNTYSSFNRNCLQIAAANGRESVVSFLLKDNKVSPRVTDGESPLRLAIQNQHTSVIEALMDFDKSLLNEKFGPDEANCLHFAVNSNKNSVVSFLLKNNFDLRLKDKQGRTPLHLAITSGSSDTIKAFFDFDRSLFDEKFEANKRSCLHIALEAKNDSVVSFLIQNKIALRETDYLKSPFYFAIYSGYFFGVKAFIEHDKSFLDEKFGPDEGNCLHVAADFGHDSIVSLLLQSGLDQKLLDRDGLPPALYACLKGYLISAKIFLENNPTFFKEYRDPTFDLSLLQVALKSGHTSIVKLALSSGVDPEEIELILKNEKYISKLTQSQLIALKLYTSGFYLFELRAFDKLHLFTPELITHFTTNKLPLKLFEELLGSFSSYLCKKFPKLNDPRKPEMLFIHSNADVFREIAEIVNKFPFLNKILFSSHIKFKPKEEVQPSQMIDFVSQMINKLGELQGKLGQEDHLVPEKKSEAVKSKPTSQEEVTQAPPKKKYESSSSATYPSVNSPKQVTTNKPKNKKGTGRGKAVEKKTTKGAPRITVEKHQQMNPSRVLAVEEPLPPLFPMQRIAAQEPSHKIEDFMKTPSTQASKAIPGDRELNELKLVRAITSLEEFQKAFSDKKEASLAINLALFDLVSKINREYPELYSFDCDLIHSTHKLFQYDLFAQFVKESYIDGFNPRQLPTHAQSFMKTLQEGERIKTMQSLIKILPKLVTLLHSKAFASVAKHAISGAIMVIGEQTARLKEESNGHFLQGIVKICNEFKAYRNLRHGAESHYEAVSFTAGENLVEGWINTGEDWEEKLNKIFEDLETYINALSRSKIMLKV